MLFVVHDEAVFPTKKIFFVCFFYGCSFFVLWIFCNFVGNIKKIVNGYNFYYKS